MGQRFPSHSRSRKAKRIVLLSDTHGQLHPAIAELVKQCDIAVHAGDIGDIGIIRALRPAMRRTIAVLGNNDVAAKWPKDQRSVLAQLPSCAQLDLAGGTLVVEHGHRAGRVAARHQALRERHPGARIIVYGHSHRLCCDFEAEPWVVNPGAAGRARTFGGASCLVLIVSEQAWKVETHRFEH